MKTHKKTGYSTKACYLLTIRTGPFYLNFHEFQVIGTDALLDDIAVEARTIAYNCKKCLEIKYIGEREIPDAEGMPVKLSKKEGK